MHSCPGGASEEVMRKIPQPERRQFGRRETLLHAVALIPGRGSVHCVVTNLSEQGANLEFAEQLSLPPVMRIKIDALGFDRACNVRHQGAHGVGVVFIDQATAERIATNVADAALRRPGKHHQPHGESGVRLREELQNSNASVPADVRSFSRVPGRVIRGV